MANEDTTSPAPEPAQPTTTPSKPVTVSVEVIGGIKSGDSSKIVKR